MHKKQGLPTSADRLRKWKAHLFWNKWFCSLRNRLYFLVAFLCIIYVLLCSDFCWIDLPSVIIITRFCWVDLPVAASLLSRLGGYKSSPPGIFPTDWSSAPWKVTEWAITLLQSSIFFWLPQCFPSLPHRRVSWLPLRCFPLPKDKRDTGRMSRQTKKNHQRTK